MSLERSSVTKVGGHECHRGESGMTKLCCGCVDEQCAGDLEASGVGSMVEVEKSGLQLVCDYVASFPFSHANYVEW